MFFSFYVLCVDDGDEDIFMKISIFQFYVMIYPFIGDVAQR